MKFTERKAIARRCNRRAIVALDDFEDAVRRIHPECSTPLAYAELQAVALELARTARGIVRRDAALWRAAEVVVRWVKRRQAQ